MTPPKWLEHEEYHRELNTQIDAIQHRLKEVEEEKMKAEKEYQIKLAER